MNFEAAKLTDAELDEIHPSDLLPSPWWLDAALRMAATAAAARMAYTILDQLVADKLAREKYGKDPITGALGYLIGQFTHAFEQAGIERQKETV